ncbi:MAG: polyphosphate kinase 1 [Gammaproteobacteria bacterium]|nr:polyphosphate kinase 1 [Gammaproteobacteria bacterium]
MVQDFVPTLPSLLEGPSKPLIHRDLSWIQFNERVLAEATSASHNPLLERLKFLSITASNLDEFFMVRVASLEALINTSLHKNTPEGKEKADRLQRIRNLIFDAVHNFDFKQAETFEQIVLELISQKIHLVKNSKESDEIFSLGRQVFEEQVLPKLVPPEAFSIVSIAQLENLQMAILFSEKYFFQIPKSIPSVLVTVRKGEGYLFLLDHLLMTYLGDFFQGIAGPIGAIRLTRDSDFSVDLELAEDTESIPDRIRNRLGQSGASKRRVVRIQSIGAFSKGFLSSLVETLKLTEKHHILSTHTLSLSGLWSAIRQLPEAFLENKKLQYASLNGCIPKSFRELPHIFDKLKQHDYLLHHPYDSFDALVALIRYACEDESVLMIEQTIYRMDVASPIIELLKQAATKGKKIRVVIELRARFDELNNLALAETLRQSGVEVAFGFGKLKLHTKMTLITRSELGEARRYTHLSTGNYNTKTAREYADLAVLTANPEIGADARLFFDSILKAKVPQSFKHLLLAPTELHRRLIAYIQAERDAARGEQPARIFAKVNALIDEEVISNLYLASQAGVTIDLIVRGACSLIPQVPHLSEKIRVMSVVDRFLEHSRIYYFKHSKAMYLSSADWMPRNFFSRLETAFPVLDERVYTYLEQYVIPTFLADTEKTCKLTSQGIWKKRTTHPGSLPVRSQQVFEKLAERDYQGTPFAPNL